MTRSALTNAAHVAEGKNRFPPEEPQDTFWQTAAQQKAQKKRWRELEYFPTPPWAVRAIIAKLSEGQRFRPFTPEHCDRTPRILEPSAGRGHIVEPLRQLGYDVTARDIFDHGKGYEVCDFTLDTREEQFDAVITNHPFSLGMAFVARGLAVAPDVLLLCRLSFLCSADRHEIFDRHLRAVYPFCERVPMKLGAYEPKHKFATEVAWFHFQRTPDDLSYPSLIHIPPGQRARFFRKEDLLI